MEPGATHMINLRNLESSHVWSVRLFLWITGDHVCVLPCGCIFRCLLPLLLAVEAGAKRCEYPSFTANKHDMSNKDIFFFFN